MRSVRFRYIILLILVFVVCVVVYKLSTRNAQKKLYSSAFDSVKSSASGIHWHAPDTSLIPDTEDGKMIKYGRELILNTAYYLGPKGKVAKVSNGMNCQNCHIDAGTKPFGNCFSAVASVYPVFRPRSGIVESIEYRVNDCMQRSLNGTTIDTTSREMKAMVAYLKWVGKDVPRGVKPAGANIEELAFLDRPADVAKGKIVYTAQCVRCHGTNGQGLVSADSAGYVYPPLWGVHSYNTGAGLYRLSRFAGYVKNNMPFGTSHEKPVLTNEEAWDVAAYVNSQSRPQRSFPKDWPNLKLKAIDQPFGPYADSFSQQQHKYGPFGPIKRAREKANATATAVK
ncbi:c-type cytochrome [Danxiaibacter flavus]|uniref:C-type cytochrome n=1 Tax=Danxiaibacter flavus TaxID=3049108 RepID=A0ABV3ZAZ6_9BACT|nr:c-type cytochrome [Chitinophagaceae bacterium DXS]